MSRALAPRTDFYDVWHKFITSGDTEGVPENVRKSWKRCRDIELDPVKDLQLLQLDHKGVNERIDLNRNLHCLMEHYYKEIEVQFDFAPFVILFTDAKGYVLAIRGHDSILRMLENSGIKNGSSLRECDVGTTAPGISLIEERPITVIAEQHYSKGFHWASCFSLPIWDYKKNILGCLDFTSTFNFGKRLEHLIPYFCNIAHSLQFEVFLKRKLELLELHDSYFRSTFEYANKILILVNRQGQIIDLNASAQRGLGLDRNKALRMGVREVVDISQTRTFLSPRKEVQVVHLLTPERASSAPFWMEIIPILNKSGDEIAYLLRLEQEKSRVALPRSLCNTARFSFEDIIGNSHPISEVVDRAKRVAKRSSNVLLEGETGTGKELFAHAIHGASNYCHGRLVAINCSAIPHELIESELFGYEKGAYTGAKREGSIGKFELANGGTIFLDEIHTMDKSGQMKLLRVLEDRQITRIGGKDSVPLDLRVIAASSKNLEKEVASGNFIEALFFRLNVVNLHIPSLREIKEDIPNLVAYFILEFNRKFRRNILGIAPDVLEIFLQYSWPGNVRELRNCIESAFNFCEDRVISLRDLKGQVLTGAGKESLGEKTIEGLTKKLMMESLDRFGNVKEAARFLDISVSTFYRKMTKFGLSKKRRYDQYIEKVD